MRPRFLVLVALAIGLYVVGTAAASVSLPDHALCQKNSGGVVSECGTVGGSSGYWGGFVYKGALDCADGCSSLPNDQSERLQWVSAANLTAGAGTGEHTLGYFEVEGWAPAGSNHNTSHCYFTDCSVEWVQAGYSLGNDCGFTNSGTPYLYVEYYLGDQNATASVTRATISPRLRTSHPARPTRSTS